jgi:heme exporter protein B
VDRGALFLGKFLANLAILLAVVAVIFPVYALFFGVAFAGSLGGIAAIVFLASVGFMLLGTLFSAVSAHTRLGETLLPVLLLPLLLPVVIFAVSGTQRLLVGRPLEEVGGNLRMLLAFDLIYLFVCTVIFGSVVEE